MRKKGRGGSSTNLYEADNNGRVSSRSVIYYHNTFLIVILDY